MIISKTWVKVKNCYVQIARCVHHPKDKRSLHPRQPTGREAVINDISLGDDILVNKGNERVGFVSRFYQVHILVGETITSNDLDVDFSQITAANVQPPAAKCFQMQPSRKKKLIQKQH